MERGVEKLDQSVIERMLGGRFRRFGAGCFCDCYASGNAVLKVFREPDEVLRRYEMHGLELAGLPWAPVPGDGLASAAELRADAIRSAKVASQRIADLACLLAADLEGETDIDVAVDGLASGQMSLADRPWYLQRFGTPLRTMLASLDQDASGRLIETTAGLIRELWERGASCRIYNVLINFGVVAGRPALLDIGDLEFHSSAVERARLELPMLCDDSFVELQARWPSAAERFQTAVSAISVL